MCRHSLSVHGLSVSEADVTTVGHSFLAANNSNMSSLLLKRGRATRRLISRGFVMLLMTKIGNWRRSRWRRWRASFPMQVGS